MARRRRVRTPLIQRWHRFRYGCLPVLGFLSASAALLWLWDTHISMPGAVGEVEVVQVDVGAPVDGLLKPFSKEEWNLFDPVQRNELVALLDDRPIQAEIGVVRAELNECRRRLDAEALAQRWDQDTELRDAERERRRLDWRIASLRLDLLDRQAEIEIAEIQVRQHDAWLESLRAGFLSRTVTDIELREENLKREETAKARDRAILAKNELATQLADAEETLAGYSDPPPRDVDKWLTPILATVSTKEAEIRRLQTEAELLEVRSPIDGVVSRIHCRPGQAVRAGNPILTISGTQGRFIVSYLRQGRHPLPEVGMEVLVRNQLPGAKPHKAFIDRVGPQYELLPPHHLMDSTRPEWGLPLRITFPTDLKALPGELLDITFVHASAKEAGDWNNGSGNL